MRPSTPFTPRSYTWWTAGGLGFVIKVTVRWLRFYFPAAGAVRSRAVKQHLAAGERKAIHGGWRDRRKKRVTSRDDATELD